MFIRVAVPVPQLDLLTYRVPDDLPNPSIGARVVVPLGSRFVTGIVVERDVRDGLTACAKATAVRRSFLRRRKTVPHVDASAIKAIRDVLDEGEFVPREVIALARWTA